jgi:hypothetical protein
MAALSFVDIDQKPPSDEGKHAPLKKTPCQSIIGCDNTGIFLKKAPLVTKMERKKTRYKNSANPPKVRLIVAFLYMHCHHLNPCLNCINPSATLLQGPTLYPTVFQGVLAVVSLRDRTGHDILCEVARIPPREQCIRKSGGYGVEPRVGTGGISEDR